jgi:hypothetical protein
LALFFASKPYVIAAGILPMAYGDSGAHACSLIGVKWFLFAFCGLGTVLGFAFVSEFLVATSLFEPAEVCRTELKPFLTIFGTSMRAK